MLQEVMPLATRNLSVAQHHDHKRFRHVRGGDYAKPKALFGVGGFAILKQPDRDVLDPPLRPLILRVVALRDCAVVVLQGHNKPPSRKTGTLFSARG